MSFSAVIQYLRKLNFFKSSLTANDEYELQNERLATRVFIIILFLFTLILVVYTAQMSITQTVKIKDPSYEQFQLFSAHYPQTLRCPCSAVSSSQHSFIELEPHFHQICTSEFVSQNWLNYLNLAVGEIAFIPDDFSNTGGLIFQTLASFCRLADKMISNGLQTFKSTTFITSEALFENVFVEQINTLIRAFQSSITLTYYQTFDLIQFSSHTNGLLSGLSSNVEYYYDPQADILFSRAHEYANGTCDCSQTFSCVTPLLIQNGSRDNFFAIPGLFKGCFLVAALRQSSLACFYEVSCIKSIEEFLQVDMAPTMSVVPLSALQESQFNVNSTIDQLLFKAMTERWTQNISHAQYFVQCRPTSCTYSFASRFNILYIVTTFIGLIGGLTKVLRLLVPGIVKIIRRRLSPPPISAWDAPSEYKCFASLSCFSPYLACF